MFLLEFKHIFVEDVILHAHGIDDEKDDNGFLPLFRCLEMLHSSSYIFPTELVRDASSRLRMFSAILSNADSSTVISSFLWPLDK